VVAGGGPARPGLGPADLRAGGVGCNGAAVQQAGRVRVGGREGRRKVGCEEVRWREKRRGGSEPLISDLMV
jgi:hypothetical protein